MKLDHDDRELILAAYRQGWSVGRIADYFGVSRRTVARIIEADERERGEMARRIARRLELAS